MKDIIMGVARHIGGAAGALFAAKGWIEADQTSLVVGVVVAVGALIASVIDKRLRAKGN